MNECKAQPEEQKSLLNALGNLEIRAKGLLDLANFSDEVVDKFNKQRPDPTPPGYEGPNEESCDKPVLDLIDLFNGVAARIDDYTNRIGRNTERIKSIIE